MVIRVLSLFAFLLVPAAESGLERRDYALDVSLPRKVFQQGEPIELTAVFKNLSGRAVTIWSSGFWPNHKLVVTDDQGIEAEFTTVGRRCRLAFDPQGRKRRKNVPRVVEPGASLEVCSGIDLSKLYRLPPGRYKVQLTYDDRQPPTPIMVESGFVTFDAR